MENRTKMWNFHSKNNKLVCFISLNLIEKYAKSKLREIILLFVFAIGLCKGPEGKSIDYEV